MVVSILAQEGYTRVRTAGSVGEALRAAEEWKPEFAILDVMLPDGDGFALLEKMRELADIPVLFLTARGEEEDKFRGFGLGADDYVVKPFSLIELTARIKANIRRATSYDNQQEETVTRIKDLEINQTTHSVKAAGTVLELTRTEFEILNLMASHPGQAFSKERLYDLIWKEPYFGNENVLNTHINRLRAKLKMVSNSDATYIKTLWGIGYKMEE